MDKELELVKDLELTRNGLGVFLKTQETLVLADLHIGLEHELMGDGTYLPVLQYPSIEKSILGLVEECSPKTLIINGDFKHEFGKITNQEWTEILNLWDALKRVEVGLELVRGNHDNFLINILKQRKKDIHFPSMINGNVLITHGHKPFHIPDDITTIILAHEHPALAFRDDAGGKHRFKCYLYGRFKGLDVLVIPAYSPLAAGVPVNSHKKKKFMTAWLNKIDTDDFIPVIVDSGEMLKFPPLKDLEPVEHYDKWIEID
jgi:putative SbcD/Mre11-related phosphoesterase